LSSPISPPPRRILLVRLSAIGDIVFASPLVSSLRRVYPDAHIAWLVQPECRALLAHHPDLDEVIDWPVWNWRALWREKRMGALASEIRAFRRTLRNRRFDLAVDLQGLLKSGILTRLSGARRRIGLGSREGSQWLMTDRIPRGGNPERIGSEYLFLAESLGLPAGDFAMAVHTGQVDQRFAEALIEREDLGRRYAVICPFTTRPQKHWFEDRWAELASRMRANLSLSVVLLGGPADVEAAARIRAMAGDALLDLTGKTSLLQAAAMIERSALLVAVDTGLGHMGIAFRRPSLLLFGSTCPYRNTARNNARVLYHSLECSPCKRKPTCNGAFDCMRAISVDEVIEAAGQVLEAGP
jgi:heptosyltransferase-1